MLNKKDALKLFFLPLILITSIGAIELAILYIINFNGASSNKTLASLATIFIGAVANIILIIYTNVVSKNLGAFYFKYLLLKFLNLNYQSKLNIDLEDNVSNLVVNPVKFYRAVFSSLYFFAYSFVTLTCSFIAATFFLGFQGILFPISLLLFYGLSLWYSLRVMKTQGKIEDEAQNTMMAQIEAYHTDYRFYYSYKQHTKFFNNFVTQQLKILNSVYLQAVVNQVPKSLFISLIIGLSLVYFYIFDLDKLTIDTNYVIGILLLVRSVGPGQSLFNTVNNLYYYQGSLAETRDIFKDLFKGEYSELRLRERGGSSYLRQFFKIDRGGIWLKGRSGIGKSVLLDELSGLLKHNEYDGTLVTGAAIFYDTDLLTNITLKDYDGSVLVKNYDKEEVSKILNLLSLPLDLDRNYGHGKNVSLSNGEKQRVMLARALYHWHDVLVIDEATYSFSEDIKNNLFKYLNSHDDRLWVLVSHQKEDSENFALVHELKTAPKKVLN